MTDFLIGGTNFGIDPEESIGRVAKNDDGAWALTLDVLGDAAVYAAIAEDETSEWSWTLYPPRFYLADYPIGEVRPGHAAEIQLAEEDYEDYDVGLYMMEHYGVSNVVVRFSPAGEIAVSGSVDLMGDEKDFEIRWILGTG